MIGYNVILADFNLKVLKKTTKPLHVKILVILLLLFSGYVVCSMLPRAPGETELSRTMISSTSLSEMVWMAGQVSMASWRLMIQSFASSSVLAEKEYVDFLA